MLNVNETTLSIEPNATDTCPEVKSTNAGYKLVFDNLDRSIKPRYMRQDLQKILLHYVQAYAVRDQINYSSISQEQRSETDLYDILPHSEDYCILKERFLVHVSRVIMTYLDFFKVNFKGLTPRHILHKYSTEMCYKSEVVILFLYFHKKMFSNN